MVKSCPAPHSVISRVSVESLNMTLLYFNGVVHFRIKNSFSVEKKLKFLRKAFQDFSPVDFNGNQCLGPFEAALKLQFGPSIRWTPLKSTIWRRILECFSSKTFISFRLKKETHAYLGWHGVSQLSGNFKWTNPLSHLFLYIHISMSFLDQPQKCHTRYTKS